MRKRTSIRCSSQSIIYRYIMQSDVTDVTSWIIHAQLARSCNCCKHHLAKREARQYCDWKFFDSGTMAPKRIERSTSPHLSASSTSISDLGPELLHTIFCKLAPSPMHMAALSCVCKEWRNVMEVKTWRQQYLENDCACIVQGNGF